MLFVQRLDPLSVVSRMVNRLVSPILPLVCRTVSRPESVVRRLSYGFLFFRCLPYGPHVGLPDGLPS